MDGWKRLSPKGNKRPLEKGDLWNTPYSPEIPYFLEYDWSIDPKSLNHPFENPKMDGNGWLSPENGWLSRKSSKIWKWMDG